MTELTPRHRNRVFKAVYKPLTYLGVEPTLFYFVCVGAFGAFNLLYSLLAGAAVFVGGYIFGRWITTAIRHSSRSWASRNDSRPTTTRPSNKCQTWRYGDVQLDKIIKPWKEADSLNASLNLYEFWDETTFLTKSGDLGGRPQGMRRRLREP